MQALHRHHSLIDRNISPLLSRHMANIAERNHTGKSIALHDQRETQTVGQEVLVDQFLQ